LRNAWRERFDNAELNALPAEAFSTVGWASVRRCSWRLRLDRCLWGPTRCCGGPNRFKEDPSLLAEGGQVEVDDLAGHQPVTERHHVGERNGERASAGRDSEPVSAAGSAERAPHDDGVVSDRHPLILGHSTLQQTSEYIDVSQEEMQAAMRKLEAVYAGS
jgi:hypothetical protein